VARAVVALAGASLLMTACGAGGSDDEGSGGEDGGTAAEVEGDTTGVTDSTIKIGTHMPLTGVAAPGYSTIPQGAKAYFDYVNANGGICDRQIEYIVRDDGYNPTNTSQVTNQLVLQDEIFAMLGGLGTPTHSAVLDFLNEQEVPDLFVSSGALAWNQPEENPFTFGWQPNYTVEGKVLGQYIAENFPEAKVGLFLQGDDFGRDGAAGIKQSIEEQIVAEVSYTPGNTDVGPQIAELQQSGADLVVGFNVPAYTALSQLVALRLNYKPQWVYSNVGSDASLVGALLSNFSKGAVADGGGLLEGIYTTKYIPTVEEPEDPWTKFFTTVWDENGANDEPLNNFRVYGMSQAYTLANALVRSCDNLNRQALIATIEEQGTEFEGPWLAPMEYDENSHRGITGLSVVQLVNGQPVKKTEILTTDDGDGAIEEYTEAADTPTESGIPDAG
jgi:ABC-type branched-subunit amino acid transport system substrate-binding protein